MPRMDASSGSDTAGSSAMRRRVPRLVCVQVHRRHLHQTRAKPLHLVRFAAPRRSPHRQAGQWDWAKCVASGRTPANQQPASPAVRRGSWSALTPSNPPKPGRRWRTVICLRRPTTEFLCAARCVRTISRPDDVNFQRNGDFAECGLVLADCGTVPPPIASATTYLRETHAE